MLCASVNFLLLGCQKSRLVHGLFKLYISQGSFYLTRFESLTLCLGAQIVVDLE